MGSPTTRVFAHAAAKPHSSAKAPLGPIPLCTCRHATVLQLGPYYSATHVLQLRPDTTAAPCSQHRLPTAALRATHPSMAVFLQRARTVPAAGFVLITSSTMLPSAHRMLLPGFTS